MNHNYETRLKDITERERVLEGNEEDVAMRQKLNSTKWDELHQKEKELKWKEQDLFARETKYATDGKVMAMKEKELERMTAELREHQMAYQVKWRVFEQEQHIVGVTKKRLEAEQERLDKRHRECEESLKDLNKQRKVLQ